MTEKSQAMEITNGIRRIYAATNGYRMQDNGYRIRITPECVQEGHDVVEIGASYFYRSQANIPAAINNVTFYADKVEEGVGFETISEIHYDDANWPKTSWATVLARIVRVREIEKLCPHG